MCWTACWTKRCVLRRRGRWVCWRGCGVCRRAMWPRWCQCGQLCVEKARPLTVCFYVAVLCSGGRCGGGVSAASCVLRMRGRWLSVLAWLCCVQEGDVEVVCGQLWCRDPNERHGACRTNSYLTALPGTPCGQGKVSSQGPVQSPQRPVQSLQRPVTTTSRSVTTTSRTVTTTSRSVTTTSHPVTTTSHPVTTSRHRDIPHHNIPSPQRPVITPVSRPTGTPNMPPRSPPPSPPKPKPIS